MIFVDAGFLLALSQPEDGLHQRAAAWSRAVTERLIVTEYVLWETVNFLSKPIDRPKAHRLLDHLRNSMEYEVVDASPDLFDEGVRLHRERSDKEWSLTDCLSFVVMQQRGIRQALAYDHHFEQAAFEALLRRDPP